jgi:5-methyltetrahydrofolate--homocysteine methyltransferase
VESRGVTDRADLRELAAAIEVGDRTSAVRLTSEALQASVKPQEILDAMTDAMGIIGRRFQDGDIFVPEMLIAARAMKEATAILEPVLVEAGIRPEHTAVIGTVEGDLHDIGKNLVGMMLKGAAINVIDLGVNVPAARFVDAAREHGASLIGLSALLTTTMPNMRAVVAAIKAADVNARVMIGGAPTTPEFAKQIGADGFAPDAGAAVDLAKQLLAAG